MRKKWQLARCYIIVEVILFAAKLKKGRELRNVLRDIEMVAKTKNKDKTKNYIYTESGTRLLCR